MLETEKTRIRRQRRAKREVDLEERGDSGSRFEVVSIASIRERPATPPARIRSLMPLKSSTLVVAQRKTGKTTFLLNLARSLRTGEEFLGAFGVEKATGKIALLNFEVSEEMIGAWAGDVGELDELQVVDLRGRRNPFVDPSDRQDLIHQLRDLEVEVVMVDTFARAFTGGSQNDAGEVTRFLCDLDRFVREECGATDLVITAHTGWGGERSRGSSALEDWPDSIITLRTLGDEPDSPRFLSARGRDVSLDEHQLTFDERTRRITLGEQESRHHAKGNVIVEGLVPVVAKVVGNASQPLNSIELSKAVRSAGGAGKDDQIRKAAGIADERHLIRIENLGAGRAKLHHAISPTP